MSIHPSLKISEADKKQRSVLKRIERLRQMMEKGDWKEGDDVYGLPKLKIIKLKFKTEKIEKVAEGAEGDALVEGAAPAEGAKPEEKSAPKEAPGKGKDKK